MHTILNQVSDEDVVMFLLELEKMIEECLDEMQPYVMSSADLDMRDHNEITVNVTNV